MSKKQEFIMILIVIGLIVFSVHFSFEYIGKQVSKFLEIPTLETTEEININVKEIKHYLDSAPEPSDFNEKFDILGKLLNVDIPHSFYAGDNYIQSEVNENFDVITEALRKELEGRE